MSVQAKASSLKRRANPESTFESDRFESSTMHDRGLQIEILALFDNQLIEVCEKLRSGPLIAVDAKFLGHTLRGAAAAIGATEIEAIAADWENAASNQLVLLRRLEVANKTFREQTDCYRSH